MPMRGSASSRSHAGAPSVYPLCPPRPIWFTGCVNDSESRIFAIVNPAAANGAVARHWPRDRQTLTRAGTDLTEERTQRSGDATRLAREAGEEGFDVVLYVGGDGTANEVANGILQLPPDARPVMAALPYGTGADLPHSLGLDPGPEAALHRLHRHHERVLDVASTTFTDADGAVVQRHYVNIADVGIGGYVAQRVNRSSKALGGFASFFWATLVEFVRLPTVELELTVDGRVRFNGPAVSVAVCNGPRFGGGMLMAPSASPDDGILDVVLIGDISSIELALNIRRLYRGTHMSHPKVRGLTGQEILVESNAAIPLEMDGEQPGTTPFRVHVEPRSLRFLV
jgi:diacylglycerol kinase (ATP)